MQAQHTFTFQIHEKPMSKLKMTGKQSWTPKAQKYIQYKEYVKGQFIDCCIGTGFKATAERSMMQTQKPIPKSGHKHGNHAHMRIDIYFDSFVHGDPENIFGAIADALFNDDKFLSGEFHYQHIGGTGPPRVDVEVKLYEHKL